MVGSRGWKGPGVVGLRWDLGGGSGVGAVGI